MLNNGSTEGMDEEEKSSLLRPTLTIGQHSQSPRPRITLPSLTPPLAFRHYQSVSTIIVETNTIGQTTQTHIMTIDSLVRSLGIIPTVTSLTLYRI